MNSKFLLALLVGASLSASAQGYKDGIEYYKAGQYDNAITLLNRNMNGADTDKALSLYYLGQSYLAQDNAQKAKQYFEEGIAANPECAFNYVGLGAIQLKNGDVQGAKDNFKKAQSHAKKNSEVTVDIARAYYNANPEAYDKEITELLKKAHKDSKDKEPSIYIFEGDRLADAQNWNDAATQYEQAIYFDQDNPEGYVKYANVYYNVVPDYAISKLAELLEVRPTSALGQRELAEKYYLNGNWTRAAEQYGKYIDNPNHFPEDKSRYAVLLYAGQKYQDAINTSNEVLQIDPDNFQVSRIIVRSYNDMKDNANALAASKRLFDNPKFADRYNASDYTTYASLLMGAQDTLASVEVLEKGLKAFPKSDALLEAMSDYYFDIKDYPKSADYGEMAINASENPSRSALYNATGAFLGASSLLRDTPEQAADYAKRGVALVDRALDGYGPTEAPVRYLRRKVLLLLAANGNVANKEVFDAAQALLTRLDADPVNADPSSDKNNLSNYVDAYRWIAQYYADQNDTDAMNAAKEKQSYYQSLMPAKN